MGGQPTLPDEGQLRTYGLVRSPEGYYSIKPVDKPKTGSTRPYLHIPKCVRCICKSICSAVQYDKPKPLQTGKNTSISDPEGVEGRKEGEKEKGKEGSQRSKYRFYPPRIAGGSMVRKMEDQDEEAEKLAKKRKVEEGKGTGSSDGRRQADKPLSISASPDRLSSAESAGLDIPMTSTRSKATMIKVEHQDSTRSPSITPIFRRAKPENESLPSLLDDGGSDFPVPLTPTSMARRASTARTSSKYHHPSQTYTRPALGRIGSTFRSVSPDSDGEVQIKPDPDERPPARQKGGNSISGRTVDTSKRVLDAIKKPLEPERTSESYASESIDVLAESGSDSPIRPVQRSIVPPIYGLFPETIELKPSTSAAGDSAAVASFTGRRLQDIEKENVALKKELARCRKQLVDQDDHAECQESIAQETRRKLAAQTQVLELGETLRSKNREIKEARAEIEGLKEEVITQKEKADKKWRQVQDLMSNTQMM